MRVNNEEKNMGLMTWDGNQIFDNETFLMYISNKVSGKYNNVYAFNSKNRAGAVYLENLNSIVPIEYSEIRAIFGQMKFEVKLNPTDAYHIYNKELKEKFIPKNPGEKFFVEYKYEDCIKYYATSGVLDADSKLYSASALYAIAITRIIELKNHVAVPSANKLNNYNYNEIKGILNDAKTILKSAMYQDSLRTKVYQDIINNCDTQLGQLETYNAQLKENSFGNQILKSILAGISEGLKQAALNSINSSIVNTNGKSQTTSNNNRPSHSSGPNSSGTTSSSNNNNGGLSDGVQARIRQVERNIVNETEYLQKAQERYKNNPTGAAKSAVEAHKRAIEGYRKQIEELKRGN